MIIFFRSTCPADINRPIVLPSKKRSERPYDDLPTTMDELSKLRKDINRESNGKPTKEQKEQLEKIKTQEKLIGGRNQDKDSRK